jgi:SPX domain protein involved in polyphosphate accumulation
VLIAPEEMLARALNGNPHLQQFRIVFFTGIRSGILSRLDRSSSDLIVRRAFTSLQLRTILEKNHHRFLIVKHPPLYKRARDMAGHVAQAMKQASRETTILLYAAAMDRHLETMAEYADTVFCFCDMQRDRAGQKSKHPG